MLHYIDCFFQICVECFSSFQNIVAFNFYEGKDDGVSFRVVPRLGFFV